MHPIRLLLLGVTASLSLQFTLPAAAAQSAADSTAPTSEAPKKKKGLFGKVKGLAKNKVVQQVAKTAACNMVPGGQLVAGALDAKKNAKRAAKDAAAGAALGAAGVKQQTCAPGGLMAGVTSKLAGGVPGVGAPGLGVAGVDVPGQPTVGAVGAAPSAEQLKQMQEQYAKMGMNPAQVQAMQQQMAASPGAGMSPEQMKQMQEQYKKMGVDPDQLRAMQEMMAGMQGGSEPAAAAEAVEPANASPAISGAPALSREKGKMLVRQLPWVPASARLQPGGEPMFGMAMQELVAAIQATPKRYKIEARVEEQGGKSQTRLLAQQRAAAVLEGLTARGVPANRLSVSGGGADKDPRIVISESK